MPVQIGTQTHSFSDPTGLLSDCHRRIETFLATLGVVAAKLDRPASEETRRALGTALKYFGHAAPKHTADEEDSLFPRLRRNQHPEFQFALSQLDQLEEEHRIAAPMHAEVEDLGARYISAGSLSTAEVERFRCAIASLVSMYNRHIQVEDSVIFPLAARLLTQEEKMDIAQEMARRRGVDPVAPPINL
jgi:hemerythrin-like domain-containing protein